VFIVTRQHTARYSLNVLQEGSNDTR